jgi:hypothetical protein
MLKVTVPVGVPVDDVTSARNVTERPKLELVGVAVAVVVEADEKIRIGKVAFSTVPWSAVNVMDTFCDGAAVVGVPEMTPLEALSVRPTGNDPGVAVHDSWAKTPTAARVCEYGWPTTPAASEVVVIAG